MQKAVVSLIFFSLITIGSGCCAWAESPPGETAPTQEEQVLIEQYLGPLPTKVQVAVALLSDNSVRFVGAERTAEGIRFIENRDSIFEIGSITKVFTSTLFALQVKNGSLNPEDPVSSRIPFKLKTSEKGGSELKLKHLVTHTSGMRHQPPGISRRSDDPFRDFDQEAFVTYLTKKMKLDFRPGEKYQYSNMGVSLLGLVLCGQGGLTYEELLQKHIFRPQGMSSSTTDLARVRDRVVPGIEKEEVEASNWDMGALNPAGGIKTSAEDFAKFIQIQFYANAAIQMTQDPAFEIEPGYYVGWGWHIIDRKDGERWLNHGGGMGGYTAVVNVNVQKKCAVIVLSNLGNAHKLADNISALGRDLLVHLEKD